MATLGGADIPTFVFFGPILPKFSETAFEELAGKLRDIGVGRVLVDRLNLKVGNWAPIRRVLEQHHASLLPIFQGALFANREYYPIVKEKLTNVLQRVGLDYILLLASKIFRGIRAP